MLLFQSYHFKRMMLSKLKFKIFTAIFAIQQHSTPTTMEQNARGCGILKHVWSYSSDTIDPGRHNKIYRFREQKIWINEQKCEISQNAVFCCRFCLRVSHWAFLGIGMMEFEPHATDTEWLTANARVTSARILVFAKKRRRSFRLQKHITGQLSGSPR